MILILFSISPVSLYSTNPISAESYNEIHYSEDDSRSFNLWTRTKMWLAKKWLKISKKGNTKGLSNIALILGIASIAALLIFFISDLGLEFLLVLAILAAIVGVILSLIVLQKTRKDKASFKKERRKAWFGIIFSSLSILSLLLVFGLILLVLLTFF